METSEREMIEMTKNVISLVNNYNENQYEVCENYHVYGEREERGLEVEVYKGRKYPIGSRYVINGFWNDMYGNQFAFMKSGEKINVDNLRRVNPLISKMVREHWIINKECAECNSKNLSYEGDGFDPGWDRNYEQYRCKDCGVRLKRMY